MLAAASAIIPIFGFPEWEWDQISEVLIYPSRFSEDFAFDDGGGHHTLGMVGTGAMKRMMILAKPDLVSGFRKHPELYRTLSTVFNQKLHDRVAALARELRP